MLKYFEILFNSPMKTSIDVSHGHGNYMRKPIYDGAIFGIVVMK